MNITDENGLIPTPEIAAHWHTNSSGVCRTIDNFHNFQSQLTSVCTQVDKLAETALKLQEDLQMHTARNRYDTTVVCSNLVSSSEKEHGYFLMESYSAVPMTSQNNKMAEVNDQSISNTSMTLVSPDKGSDYVQTDTSQTTNFFNTISPCTDNYKDEDIIVCRARLQTDISVNNETITLSENESNKDFQFSRTDFLNSAIKFDLNPNRVKSTVLSDQTDNDQKSSSCTIKNLSHSDVIHSVSENVDDFRQCKTNPSSVKNGSDTDSMSMNSMSEDDLHIYLGSSVEMNHSSIDTQSTSEQNSYLKSDDNIILEKIHSEIETQHQTSVRIYLDNSSSSKFSKEGSKRNMNMLRNSLSEGDLLTALPNMDNHSSQEEQPPQLGIVDSSSESCQEQPVANQKRPQIHTYVKGPGSYRKRSKSIVSLTLYGSITRFKSTQSYNSTKNNLDVRMRSSTTPTIQDILPQDNGTMNGSNTGHQQEISNAAGSRTSGVGYDSASSVVGAMERSTSEVFVPSHECHSKDYARLNTGIGNSMSASNLCNTAWMQKGNAEKMDQRSLIIQELISTERKYCEGLQTLVHFISSTFRDSGIIPPRDMNIIFPVSLPELVRIHSSLLHKMEVSQLHSSPSVMVISNFDTQASMRSTSSGTSSASVTSSSTSKESAFLVPGEGQPSDGTLTSSSNVESLLLDALRTNDSELFELYQSYLNDFAPAMETLTKHTKNSAKLRKIILDLQGNSQCAGLDPASYLLTPVQRLPRYLLLVKQLASLNQNFYNPSQHHILKSLRERLEDFLNQVDSSLSAALSGGRKKKRSIRNSLFTMGSMDSLHFNASGNSSPARPMSMIDTSSGDSATTYTNRTGVLGKLLSRQRYSSSNQSGALLGNNDRENPSVITNQQQRSNTSSPSPMVNGISNGHLKQQQYYLRQHQRPRRLSEQPRVQSAVTLGENRGDSDHVNTTGSNRNSRLVERTIRSNKESMTVQDVKITASNKLFERNEQSGGFSIDEDDVKNSPINKICLPIEKQEHERSSAPVETSRSGKLVAVTEAKLASRIPESSNPASTNPEVSVSQPRNPSGSPNYRNLTSSSIPSSPLLSSATSSVITSNDSNSQSSSVTFSPRFSVLHSVSARKLSSPSEESDVSNGRHSSSSTLSSSSSTDSDSKLAIVTPFQELQNPSLLRISQPLHHRSSYMAAMEAGEDRSRERIIINEHYQQPAYGHIVPTSGQPRAVRGHPSTTGPSSNIQQEPSKPFSVMTSIKKILRKNKPNSNPFPRAASVGSHINVNYRTNQPINSNYPPLATQQSANNSEARFPANNNDSRRSESEV